jgi:hypothetical protein
MRIITEVIAERKNIRHLMKRRGIKIFARKVIDGEFIDWPYLVRGYEGIQRLWTAAIRKRINELLAERL